MREHDLPLFAWKPACKIVLFPMVARVGKVRDVASKMLDKATDRHADYYRRQVTEALISQLDRTGIPENEQDEQLGAFWDAVQNEMIRQCYGSGALGNDPRGAA
ncbi:hypothetical protein FP026_08430 [Rhizobium tropici]|uniref:Uncharacterized protein n=1 Tax=Rhizobium tropici TaxID=398 RepID=A0A5B0W510_RHITR|nr:DUF6074 family protein [Rhizobium tropici]KAA1182103.1 hypothetical protein FP026_08430 [Rhizobium tropici]